MLNLLLSQRFGLNVGVPDKALAENARWLGILADAGKDAKPVDLKAVAPYLGYYEGGYSLVREGRDLKLRIGPRVFPLQVTPRRFVRHVRRVHGRRRGQARAGARRDPHVEIVGVETVRRNTG